MHSNSIYYIDLILYWKWLTFCYLSYIIAINEKAIIIKDKHINSQIILLNRESCLKFEPDICSFFI